VVKSNSTDILRIYNHSTHNRLDWTSVSTRHLFQLVIQTFMMHRSARTVARALPRSIRQTPPSSSICGPLAYNRTSPSSFIAASRSLYSSKQAWIPQSSKTSSSIHPRSFHASARTMTSRTETDAFGPVEVESNKYWGAQTQRSLKNFDINQPQDRMPPPIVKAFGILKGAAATVNMRYGLGMCRY
jgi:fumarate hydratase class II